MTLLEILTLAREKWNDHYSTYICDCITGAVDDQWPHGPSVGRYVSVEPVIQWISDRINYEFSVYQYLFPQYGRDWFFKTTEDDLKRAKEFREALWDEIFKEFGDAS